MPRPPRLSLWLIVALWAVLGAGLPAQAATGITLSPFSQSLVIPPNETSYAFSLAVTNNTAYAQNLEAKAVDLGGLDDTGGLQLSTTAGSANAKYALASYLQLDTTSFTLGAGEGRTLRGKVINVDSLTPGTHYAALLITKPAATVSGTKVPLQTVIASTLLVRKTGGERYGLELQKVDRSTSWWKRLELTLHFRNTGNVGLVPRGLVRVLDPFGQEVARGVINEASGMVLPESSRKYQVAQDYIRPVLWPGQYTYIIQYRYDGRDEFSEQRLTEFYVDSRSILALVTVLLVLGAAAWIFWLRPRRKRRQS